MSEIEKALQDAKYAVLDTRPERRILQEMSVVEAELRASRDKETSTAMAVCEELDREVGALTEGLEQTRRSSVQLRDEAVVLDKARQDRSRELALAEEKRSLLKQGLFGLRADGAELQQTYQESVCERERAYLKDAWLRYQMYTAVTGIRWDEDADDGQKGYISLDGLLRFDLRQSEEEKGTAAAPASAQAVRAADQLWAKIAEAAPPR